MIALDLRGHGDSTWEPPWHLEQHVADVLDAAPEERCTWLGHSFGGRIAYEVAAAVPERVERLVLLDPAIWLPPHVGSRPRRTPARTGRTPRSPRGSTAATRRASSRPRRARSSRTGCATTSSPARRPLPLPLLPEHVVAAYGEMTREPPPFERVRVPTLLVLGETSYLPYDHLLDRHRAALGDLLQVERIAAGHTVLWDALDDTADAVDRFLR